jgi:hypothetical protein
LFFLKKESIRCLCRAKLERSEERLAASHARIEALIGGGGDNNNNDDDEGDGMMIFWKRFFFC